MSTYLSAELRRLLWEADNGQCAYCQTREDNSGQALTTDHIVPTSRGGQTVFLNLCRACRRCNERKREQLEAIDPLAGDHISLFSPRQQLWPEHFTWELTGIHITGLTACGRATVRALDMNNELIVFARRRWVNAGWHPPQDA